MTLARTKVGIKTLAKSLMATRRKLCYVNQFGYQKEPDRGLKCPQQTERFYVIRAWILSSNRCRNSSGSLQTIWLR